MASPHPLSASSLFSSLKGWVAVVTGGGTGVGLVIAQTLAVNGAKVYITGRRADVLETSARLYGSPDRLGPQGGSIVPLVMDVTSKESIRKAVDEIAQKETCVNILVNNAGTWLGRTLARPTDGPEVFGKAMFDEEMEGNWQKTFHTNSTSIFFVTAAFLPLLAKSEASPTGKIGSVINNTSISGSLRMSQNCQFSYNASKAAANHITRQMALELSQDAIKVRVNGLALGYFPSELTVGPSNAENEIPPYDVEKFREGAAAMGARTVKRMGAPEELASVILTLATNDFLWGSIIPLDGGFSLTGTIILNESIKMAMTILIDVTGMRCFYIE
ncbi:hypothetical protein F4810DRAFT_711081 [Camillea tinctor]|nr:hypothetical protein F4810DRAFT_711081 [Camillea tinctor]